MEFGICCCPRSLVKLGVPHIEPEPRKHPGCPQCGEPMKVVQGLAALAREIISHTIDKCIWWPEHLAGTANGFPPTPDWTAACERILIHLRAAQSRINHGESFDSYSEAF